MINTDTLKALEFEKVLSIASSYAKSPVARDLVLNIKPLSNRKDIETRSGEIGDIRRLTQDGTPLALSSFDDISDLLERVRPKDSVLDSTEILLFAPVLQMASSIPAQLEEQDGLAHLKSLTAGLMAYPDLLGLIENSIDGEGNILDTASSVLFDLRVKIRAFEKKINRRLEEILRDRDIEPFLQDSFITKRTGRWVIPVRMDAKGQVKGVVHDVSSSGETAFMEPLEILGAANELENLIADARAEEIRILRGICQEIRAREDDIRADFKTIVHIDVLNSIAKFSDALSMETPVINEQSVLRLDGACHPLLLWIQKKGSRGNVVPLDLHLGHLGHLGDEEKVMLITGPNAGGKTVSLKTAGLLCLMAQSGMPVTARSSSSFPLVHDLLVDIGDEQSIESSLSTFSAHVSNIAGIVNKAGPGTLVLMDELGTGTDPLQGAAIGCAVISGLMKKGAMVVATTHLTEVVAFVQKTEGMVNASMEFDANTLRPLYRLKTGEPGQSHALEIAEMYGLPKDVLASAKELLGAGQSELYGLLAELKDKRKEHEDTLSRLEAERAELKDMRARLEEKLKKAEAEKTEIIRRAYEEAKEIVRDIKKNVFDILDEVKQKKKRDSIRVLDAVGKKVDKKIAELTPEEPTLSADEIKAGDTVFVGSLRCDAEVLEVGKNKLRVKVGQKEIEVPLTGIGKAKGRKEVKKPSVDIEYSGVMPDEAVMELNVVGMRVDDALIEIEPFLNRASLQGLESVLIIHGIGTGALRQATRELLEGHPLVRSHRQGRQEEGGDGVTVVELR
jgi:DNA mismatch repair protein MutS2